MGYGPLVQSTGNQFANSASGRPLTFPGACAVNNLLVVPAIVFQTTDPTASVADTAGHTWTQAVLLSDVAAFDAKLYIWYAVNTSAAAHTVTVTPSASAFVSFGILEFTGNALASVQDGAGATGGPAASATPATGSLTIGQANDLVVGVVTHNGASTTAIGVGANYTQAFEAEGITNMPINIEYDLDVDANQAADWTFVASKTFMAVAAAFKEAAAGGQDTPELYGRPGGLRGFRQMAPLLTQ